METSKQQTLPFGEGKLTCSRGDFRASHFQQPGNGKVQPITVISGRKCCERFAKLVPGGSWAKTFSELLIGREDWFSNACTLTWKMRGTRSRRLYFQLAASEHRTSDTECGLLPTVQTQGLKVNEDGKTVFMNMNLLPTPTATDKGSGRINKSPSHGASNRPSIALAAKMGLLPTPTANDGKNATLPESQKERISLVSEAMKYNIDGQTSQLNPLYVQEMMGFPYLWTELPFQSGGPNPSNPTETR